MQNAAAELTCCFFGECEGYDFFRLNAEHEQGNETGGQLIGLTRAGRCRDARAGGVVNLFLLF